jgi:exopolysaccharide production protein ExoQ
MPPTLALLLTFGFIFASWRRDIEDDDGVSPAIWLPLLWMFLIATRYLSQWITMAGEVRLGSADEYLEGSPIDQAVFSGLLLLALVVLVKRRVTLGQVFRSNLWLSLFLIYALLSVGWSDFPFTALKRYVKVIEHVVMALVVLTERNPDKAMDVLIRRFSIVCVIMSVTFLKYFPEFSRRFDQWTGAPFNTGITTDKNALGHICLIASLYLTSSWFSQEHRKLRDFSRFNIFVDVALVLSIVWLMDMANAKTALVCSALGSVLIFVLARTSLGKHPGRFVLVCALIAATGAVLEAMFNLREASFEALGRDATLTDRVFVWADVLSINVNPMIGTGFESFWLGWRAEYMWEKYWWHPNQAHNGYIETYINLGAIGAGLLAAAILQAALRILRKLPEPNVFEPMKLAFLVSLLVFNYTDATFKALHIMYFMFYLCAITAPPTPTRRQARI